MTRESKKPEPDKNIHNSNENDNADASFFNSWRKQENNTLALTSPLSAFQQYYNKYGNIDDSVILYGHRRNSAGKLSTE